MEKRPILAKAGTNLGGASAHNRRVVVDALRINGALSRAELARATHLTAQTVSNIIAELEGDGLVDTAGPVRIARGQPARPYRLVPSGAFALGVQIDRHCSRVLAVDLVGSDLVRLERALPPGGPEAGVPVVLGLVAEARAALAAAHGQAEARLVGLGVAMPGPFGLPSAGEDPWMMSAWQAYPLLEALAIGTGLEVGLRNDAAAAATAERIAGDAAGLDDFVYLYFGYGLGAGIVVNGEIFGGGRGNAGEIGMIVPFRGPGDAGHVEETLSVAGLCRAVGLDPSSPTLFADIEAALGAPAMRGWLDAAAPLLRWAVHVVESLLDPQTIVIGGSAPRTLIERLVARAEPLMPSTADRPGRTVPRVVLGRADPWMVARGAAAEPISRAFDPRFSAILKARW